MITPIYGILAEFESPSTLTAAARQVKAKGYNKVEAYSPFAIEEVNEALGLHHNRLPLIVLGCGILGGLTGYLMQYYLAVIDFPINVGARPLHSWPSFIIITFELTILFAALATVLGLLGLCGLPMPYHPVFNLPRFALASRNRFFLCIEATDPLFNRHETAEFLSTLEAREVSEVAH
ncbi:MAG: DUF3341 domain-containing protein [Acidobacteria bacterium]|nr:MAG: DUF3341 domain-containing protein [Acidobacteriota bacterium]